MNGEKLVVPIFILGICCVIPLAIVLINIRLVKDFAESLRRRIGLFHQAPKPMPLIDFFPSGDIPQPESSTIGEGLSAHR